MDDETRQWRLRAIEQEARMIKGGTCLILVDPALVDEWRGLVSEAGLEERFEVVGEPEEAGRKRVRFSKQRPKRPVAGPEVRIADLEHYVEQLESALVGIKTTISQMKESAG